MKPEESVSMFYLYPVLWCFRSFCELESNREKAATPTLEMTDRGRGLNESGYEGDEEDVNLSLLDSSLGKETSIEFHILWSLFPP